ncbi:hypothetical protein SLEP1_g49759 [Rubroshorea leprosula]|uniref:Uncharacterized protein n=1 Tax=Rubroshorea leprosula TaxID=152421 RepID=A0AAV5LXV0_9ROSI|nr:hypothetical protein SLEP1_g49759 [Rubroshorea leprosula]
MGCLRAREQGLNERNLDMIMDNRSTKGEGQFYRGLSSPILAFLLPRNGKRSNSGPRRRGGVVSRSSLPNKGEGKVDFGGKRKDRGSGTGDEERGRKGIVGADGMVTFTPDGRFNMDFQPC